MKGIIYFTLFLVIGVSAALVSFPQLSKVSKKSFSKSTKNKIAPSYSTSNSSVFLIAANDNGTLGKKIGCGDSVVAFRPPPHPDDPGESKLEQAYRALLTIKPETYNSSGLINALEDSSLKLDKAEIKGGVATVKLSGRVSLKGVCDNPRFKAQLEEAALQLPEVERVKITINGQDLDSLLSGKGI